MGEEPDRSCIAPQCCVGVWFVGLGRLARSVISFGCSCCLSSSSTKGSEVLGVEMLSAKTVITCCLEITYD